MCGIFGVWRANKAAELTVIGLHGNQHRAIDFAGIVSTDGAHFYRERGEGLARQVYTKALLDRLHGTSSLGHIRYPTVADDKTRDNTQPIVGIWNGGPVALAHNGNLTNVAELKELLGLPAFATSMDSELILRLLERCRSGDIITDLKEVLPLLEGSVTLGIMLPHALIAVRDRSGNRPLSIGKAGESVFLSSETCVFPNLDAELVSDVEAGTITLIGKDGVSHFPFADKQEKKCRFEAIYYSHPSSQTFGEDVGRFRIAVGRELERLFPAIGADIIVPVPDSANFIAKGYEESGRSGTHVQAIIRSHYVGRTFIAATQTMRDAAVTQKFTFTASEIRGRRIVLVDDSIVRGTTLPTIIRKLRRLGAQEVHVRIGSPPITFPCAYGINTPTRAELVSAALSPQEVCKRFGADSLEFLPLEALRSLSPDPDSFCYACMDGNYWHSKFMPGAAP